MAMTRRDVLKGGILTLVAGGALMNCGLAPDEFVVTKQEAAYEAIRRNPRYQVEYFRGEQTSGWVVSAREGREYPMTPGHRRYLWITVDGESLGSKALEQPVGVGVIIRVRTITFRPEKAALT